MSGVDALIFDKDGTLFDFSATWEAWASAFLLRVSGGDRDRAKRLGAAIEYDFDDRKFARSSVVIAGTAEDVIDALIPHFPDHSRATLKSVLNDEAAKAPQSEAVPLVPLLSGLRARGLRLGVATNDTEAPARAHLGQAGVTEFFDFIAGYDSGFGGKPAPGQLHAFAAHVDLPADRIAMIGDSTHDLHAGRAAGMRTVAVLTGLAEATTLAPFADVVLPDIGHLPDWLDGLSG